MIRENSGPFSAKATVPTSKPRVFNFQQGLAWESTGYPIFVRRVVDQQETDLHSHGYHEIVLIESGTADHFTASGIQKLRAGDLIVLKPKIWHQYRNTKNFQIINCLFDRRVLRHHRTFLSLLDNAFELFCKPPPKPLITSPVLLHATPAQRVRVNDLLVAMIRERKEKQPDWQAAMTVHLLDLMVSISRLTRGVSPQETAPLPERIRDFVDEVTGYLETGYREPFSLEQLSKQFYVSASHLSRVFSKRMGMGLVDYIHHLRIEEACRLLRSTDWSISRIAGEVGYNEIAYFARRFRKDIGMSAKEYRNLPCL